MDKIQDCAGKHLLTRQNHETPSSALHWILIEYTLYKVYNMVRNT